MFDRSVVLEAVSRHDALRAFDLITGLMLDVLAVPVTTATWDETDVLIDRIDAWWGAYCDRANGNDSISDADYDEVLDFMNKSYDAVYAMQRELCRLERLKR